jgi:hypothetical protein
MTKFKEGFSVTVDDCYLNDETTTLEDDFYKEFPNSTIEILEGCSISGVQIEEIECSGFDDLVSYCAISEGLIGECFSVYDDKGHLILTEEYLEETEYEDL